MRNYITSTPRCVENSVRAAQVRRPLINKLIGNSRINLKTPCPPTPQTSSTPQSPPSAHPTRDGGHAEYLCVVLRWRFRTEGKGEIVLDFRVACLSLPYMSENTIANWRATPQTNCRPHFQDTSTVLANRRSGLSLVLSIFPSVPKVDFTDLLLQVLVREIRILPQKLPKRLHNQIQAFRVLTHVPRCPCTFVSNVFCTLRLKIGRLQLPKLNVSTRHANSP